MSILDGLPTDEQELREALAVATAILEGTLRRRKPTPRQRQTLDLIDKGLSLSDIYGITQAETDAVMAVGCRQMQVGDHAAAMDTFTGLVRLDPTNASAVYALAASCQAQGVYDVAGKIYIQFLALDATNPQGYLRLGECFLANREHEAARSCFEAAKMLTARGKPDPAVVAHADAMIATLGTGRADAA